MLIDVFLSHAAVGEAFSLKSSSTLPPGAVLCCFQFFITEVFIPLHQGSRVTAGSAEETKLFICSVLANLRASRTNFPYESEE